MNDFDLLRETVALKRYECWKRFYRGAAFCGASSCLSDVPEITEPVEQVKYLFNRFKTSEEYMMKVPLSYLALCLEKGTIPSLKTGTWFKDLLDHVTKIGNFSLIPRFLDVCLTDDLSDIDDPVEQIKYLFDIFKGYEENMMDIPLSYLDFCLNDGIISLSESEVWFKDLLNYTNSVGGPLLSLRFSQICLRYA